MKTERKQPEKELSKHREQLKELVEERTAELRAANEHLRREIIDRKRVEEELYKSERFFSTIFGSIRDPSVLLTVITK